MIDQETAEKTLGWLLMCMIELIEEAHPDLVAGSQTQEQRIALAGQVGAALVSFVSAAQTVCCLTSTPKT